MKKDKRNSQKRHSREEPTNRFYVRKWQATKKEMSEVRQFVQSNKSSSDKWNDSIGQSEAFRKRTELVR